jgi:glycine amidinotransferase
MNEWDLLEEVIVGSVDGATVPGWSDALAVTMPDGQEPFFREHGGRPWPAHEVAAAARELDTLTAILEAEGVRVRRPAPFDHGAVYQTPHFGPTAGLYSAMPRDVALIIGDTIIEAPMPWRTRYFETFALRDLFREYFAAGARWLSAPKPRLRDELFRDPALGGLLLTEDEPVFDAADFLKFGRDVLAQRSHVTNGAGIEWVRRHLGPEFVVHEFAFEDEHPMHIDATVMPLAPGKLLANPDRAPKLPEFLRGWDVLYAPPPTIPREHPMHMSSAWVTMNLISIDHERVVVEASEEPLIRALRDFGMKVVPCPFRHFNTFGGSFHCATLDVRRRPLVSSDLEVKR